MSTIAPCEVESLADVLSLDSSLREYGRWYISVSHDGSVGLTEQKSGCPPTAHIRVPRGTFNRLIAWYQTPQAARAPEGQR